MFYVEIEDGFFDITEERYDNYAEAVSRLWTYGETNNIEYPSQASIFDENLKLLQIFIYNKEKKGYRPIEPIEWE